MLRKALWAAAMLVLLGGTYWIISGLDTELKRYEVIPDDELHLIGPVMGSAETGDWGFDESGSFFVEYRLQRERVRSQEIEMLEQLIGNNKASAESKLQAEAMLLDLILLMEQELLVENMLRAQGYDDAIFFYRNRAATVMVKKGELSEREFVQITDAVAGLVGVGREEVQVITRP